MSLQPRYQTDFIGDWKWRAVSNYTWTTGINQDCAGKSVLIVTFIMRVADLSKTQPFLQALMANKTDNNLLHEL